MSDTTSPRWERITASQIVKGDLVARARTHEPRRIHAVKHGPVAAILYGERSLSGWERERSEGHDRVLYCIARPRLSAKWWRYHP